MKTVWMLLHRFNHSRNVARNCRDLSSHMGHDKEFVDIAELMGYYHDVAVFEEILDDDSDNKIKALLVYGCLREPPHARSECGINTLFAHRGSK